MSARTAGITAVAAAIVAALVWLGRWQYDAYDEHQRQDADSTLALPAVPLDDVLTPDAPFRSDAVSRPVTVSGRYAAAEQFYVTGMADAAGDVAVVAPLVTDSGSAVLVVRGLSATRPAAPPPTGEVRVDGVLEPSQSAAAALDRTRTTDGIQIARLVSSFEEDLYAGYVIARSSTPQDALRAAQVPQPDASFWAGFRNLLYALQWWAFAAFAVFMWWRIIREPPGDDDAPDDDRHLVGSTPPAGGDSEVG